jgi:hypothetical protein
MRWISVAVALGFATGLALAQNQPAAPQDAGAIEFGFDADAAPWTALDDTAVLSVTHEADEIKAGTGALKWQFTPAAGKMPALVAQTAPAPDAQSMAVWVRSSVACVLAVGLMEAGGARYVTAAYCPANDWQHLEVALKDFMLSDDTPDDDNQLDADQITGCMMIDLAAMLIQEPGAQQFVALTAAPRTILVDDLRISPQQVAPQHVVRDAPGGGKEVTLQTFDTGALFIIPLRNTTVRGVQLQGGQGGAAMLSYDLSNAEVPIAGMLMPVQAGQLAGLARLRLVVASQQPITLAVTMEEKPDPGRGLDKSNYMATRTLAGGGQWETIEFSRDDFRLSNDSSDENGQLDTDQVGMVAAIDASAMTGGAPTPANIVSIDEITAITTQ